MLVVIALLGEIEIKSLTLPRTLVLPRISVIVTHLSCRLSLSFRSHPNKVTGHINQLVVGNGLPAYSNYSDFLSTLHFPLSFTLTVEILTVSSQSLYQ